ncbi:hypothetical protein [Streptomyces sp. NPDC059928]|uniref:hypothetical protein n=1 Tax=unclassified Streptomyces TaxID=2593676 RepID=UPI0036540069
MNDALRQLDADSDGRISEEEFVTAFTDFFTALADAAAGVGCWAAPDHSPAPAKPCVPARSATPLGLAGLPQPHAPLGHRRPRQHRPCARRKRDAADLVGRAYGQPLMRISGCRLPPG